ncbi:hypothetical protein EMCRGX_G011905 [Ephydatia muelleri]
MFAKPMVWKEPVAANMLKAMVEAAGPAPSLMEVRLCLMAFAGFMQCDELVKLKLLMLPSILRAWWLKLSLVTCPVGMMERYFRMGEVDHSSQAMLFQGIVQTKDQG